MEFYIAQVVVATHESASSDKTNVHLSYRWNESRGNDILLRTGNIVRLIISSTRSFPPGKGNIHSIYMCVNLRSLSRLLLIRIDTLSS